eukprot:1373135-Amorphochlora_amoeboformis.AAC.1
MESSIDTEQPIPATKTFSSLCFGAFRPIPETRGNITKSEEKSTKSNVDSSGMPLGYNTLVLRGSSVGGNEGKSCSCVKGIHYLVIPSRYWECRDWVILPKTNRENNDL